jgi:TfoX/Sxy family transcriptional regulator of competence genes
MGKANYNTEIKNVLDSFLLKTAIVVPGKMFGYPAYYVNKKLFACVYEDGVGLKVPFNLANELIGKEGIIPFEPMGKRKMKEWIQINRELPEDYLNDIEIFEKSIEFVATLEGR